MKIWVLTMLLVWMLGHPTQETCEGYSVWKSDNSRNPLCNWMGNANSLFFFHLGERKGFYTILQLKQGKIGEDLGNKMKFPFVHFCFNHISGKIIFFWSAMSEEGKALEEGHANKMQFPCVHFSICHLAVKIRLFFWARNLKRGKDLNASSLSTIFASNTLQGK
jgi:hypothetical protein